MGYLSAAGQTDTLVINNNKIDFGQRSAKNRPIDAIIIHSTYYNWDGAPFLLENIISVFRAYGVSAHYIIDRKGNVFSLVNERNIAFHAGAGIFPDGATKGANDRSIGIELMTNFYSSPTDAQMESLVKLVANIQRRYNIKYILRHSDIAPDRKTDPWHFDWDLFLDKLKNTNKRVILRMKN
ncbi:MAG: N-acetylmuramoyl-L-alanine amidase [Paludibacter sp.]|nr:N-acetylmuramoyl-L-alanine amidase [Paludibacter sp.]